MDRDVWIDACQRPPHQLDLAPQALDQLGLVATLDPQHRIAEEPAFDPQPAVVALGVNHPNTRRANRQVIDVGAIAQDPALLGIVTERRVLEADPVHLKPVALLVIGGSLPGPSQAEHEHHACAPT